MSRIRLPRWAVALLRVAVPREWQGAVLSDLEELFASKAPTRPVIARLWLLGQVVSFAAAFGWARLRDRRRVVRPIHESPVEASRGHRVGDWVRELRHAGRRLVREPSITLPALVTLALGISASTAVFALVYSVLLRPLPYPEPHDIVDVGHTTSTAGLERVGQAPGTYAHYAENNRVFEAMALYAENAVSVSITDGDAPERVRIAIATPGLFDVFRTQPTLGRPFTERDLDIPADSQSAVIISHELWTRRYGADLAIIGKSIELNRRRRDVIGVMPPGFDFPHRDTDVWYPYQFEPRTGEIARDLGLSSVARLRPDVELETATDDLSQLLAALDGSPELSDGSVRPSVVPLRAQFVDDVRQPLLILAMATTFVLLVSLANVSGLILVRAERRGEEIAVFRALGARGQDLRRRFFSEGLVLAAAGGLLGSFLAWIAIRVRFGLGLDDLPRLHELDFGTTPGLFIVGLSVFVALSIGLVSLIRSSRFSHVQTESLAGNRAAGGRGWTRVHGGLAAVQIALSMGLLVGCGFMVESLARLSRIDPGFDSAGMLTFRINPSATDYLEYERAAGLHWELRNRLLALPGVTHVELSSWLPLTNTRGAASDRVQAEGEPLNRDARPAALSLVTPGYFAAMGIPLLRGVAFGIMDADADAPPVVISEGLAGQLFAERDPIGRRITLPGYGRFIDLPRFTVAGVVGDVAAETLTRDPAPILYFPALLEPGTRASGVYPLIPRAMAIVVKSAIAPLEHTAAVSSIVRDLDPRLPVTDNMLLVDVERAATSRMRLVTTLLSITAMASLLLGLTGVYGIVSYSSRLRTREIGVRVAVGATSAQVVRLIMAGTTRIAAVGVALGLLAAFTLTRILGSQLYGVNTSAPWHYIATGAVLVAVVMVAAWLPARRASQLNVLEALAS